MQKGDITDDATAQADDISGLKVSGKGTLWDLVVPILSLIVFCILAMLYTGGYFAGGIGLFDAFGNTNANLSLAMGGFGAIIVAALLFLPRRILTFRDFMDGLTAGFKSMVPACTILTLAWTLKGVCDALSVGPYMCPKWSARPACPSPFCLPLCLRWRRSVLLHRHGLGDVWHPHSHCGAHLPERGYFHPQHHAGRHAGGLCVRRPLLAHLRHHHPLFHGGRVRPHHTRLHTNSLCAAGGGVLFCGLSCGRVYAQCVHHAGIQRGAAGWRAVFAAQIHAEESAAAKAELAQRSEGWGCLLACIARCIRGCLSRGRR